MAKKEFEVGDLVVVKHGKYTGSPSRSQYNLPRGPGVVAFSKPGAITIDYRPGGEISPPVLPCHFTLFQKKEPEMKFKVGDTIKNKFGSSEHKVVGVTPGGRFVVERSDNFASYEWLIEKCDEHCWEIVPRETSGWINVYRSGPDIHTSKLHITKEKADEHAPVSRIACIPVTFKEGEGL